MRYMARRHLLVLACFFLAAEITFPSMLQAQESPDRSSASHFPQEDLETLATLVHQLQNQIQILGSQVVALHDDGQNIRSQAVALRQELDVTKAQLASLASNEGRVAEVLDNAREYSNQPILSDSLISNPAAKGMPERPSLPERTAALEEGLQLANDKITEQSQTKVESGSKYRLRLSGIMLFNLFSNRGGLDNQDFPEITTPSTSLSSTATFGGSVRQSQVNIQAFGPDIAGARTSAEFRLDLAGGFPGTANGVAYGIMRLRTGAARLDWSNTSIIAGQDQLFFSPLNPTSIASMAVPPLSYAGNLWSWTPQVRIERRFALSDTSVFLLQGGILDALSGEVTSSEYGRAPTRGEQSGQPAYAGRMAWSDRLSGQKIAVGIGGYYSRQSWGLNRNIAAWTGTADLILPLGKMFELSGEFYRERGTGGLGGGIGQSVLWNGFLGNASTGLRALDSVGGWAQLKFKPVPKFEVNGAFGEDNPFSSELRLFKGNKLYLGPLLSKNLSSFVNFIYQPRSDIVFSIEYRYLKTAVLDNYPNSAHLIDFSLGYIF